MSSCPYVSTLHTRVTTQLPDGQVSTFREPGKFSTSLCRYERRKTYYPPTYQTVLQISNSKPAIRDHTLLFLPRPMLPYIENSPPCPCADYSHQIHAPYSQPTVVSLTRLEHSNNNCSNYCWGNKNKGKFIRTNVTKPSIFWGPPPRTVLLSRRILDILPDRQLVACECREVIEYHLDFFVGGSVLGFSGYLYFWLLSKYNRLTEFGAKAWRY